MDLTNSISLSENISEVFNQNLSDFHRQPVTRVIGSLIIFLIAIISIIGNAAVVIVSFKFETLRTQIRNLLIVYLSSVDILTALLVMMPSALSIALDYWPLGDRMCKFHAFLNYSFACASSVNLMIISVDRAIALAYPFKYHSKMTRKVMLKICFFIFTVSFAVGCLCGLPDWTQFNYTEAACTMKYTTKGEVYYAYTAACFACGYIPLGAITFCCIYIIHTARRSEKKNLFIRRITNKNSSNVISETGYPFNKTMKSMIVVIIAYVVLYSPYGISKQIKVVLLIEMPPEVNLLSTIFMYLSSAVNPFIYAILRKDYRDAFKKLVKC